MCSTCESYRNGIRWQQRSVWFKAQSWILQPHAQPIRLLEKVVSGRSSDVCQLCSRATCDSCLRHLPLKVTKTSLNVCFVSKAVFLTIKCAFWIDVKGAGFNVSCHFWSTSKHFLHCFSEQPRIYFPRNINLLLLSCRLSSDLLSLLGGRNTSNGF